MFAYTTRVRLVAVITILTALLVSASLAGAQTIIIDSRIEEVFAQALADGEGQHVNESGDVINRGGDVDITRDQVVEGNVVAEGGTVHIHGRVKGSVFAVGGDVHLYPGSHVVGDIVANGGEVIQDDGSQAWGSITSTPRITTAETAVPVEAPEPLEPVTPLEPVVPAEPAPVAEEPQPAPQKRHLRQVVNFAGPIHVQADEIVDGDCVAFAGPIAVDGEVMGNCVAMAGPITVNGHVHGDTVAMAGSITARNGSHIGGNAVTFAGPVVREEGSHIGGTVGGPGLPPISIPGLRDHGLPTLARVTTWMFTTLCFLLFAGLMALLTPKAVDAAARRIDEEPMRVVMHGIMGWLLVLPIAILLCVLVFTWLLLPFYVLLVGAAVMFGSVAVGLYVGRRVSKLFKWRAASVLSFTAIGVIALRATEIVSWLPGGWIGDLITGLVSTAVLVLAMGTIIITKFGTDPTGTWLGKKHKNNGNGGGGATVGAPEIFVGDSTRIPVPPKDPTIDDEARRLAEEQDPGPDPDLDEFDDRTKTALNEIPDPDGEEDAAGDDGPADLA